MEATLEATARDTFGKNENNRTRRGGLVPAVLYGTSDGPNKEAKPISVNPKALLKILHSESGVNTLISLKLAGAGDTRVLVKEFQLDPVTHAVLHADFYRGAMGKTIQETTPVIVARNRPSVIRSMRFWSVVPPPLTSATSRIGVAVKRNS